jgi:ABC-type Fe3+-hydroxamate transport system substrate-binding protein
VNPRNLNTVLETIREVGKILNAGDNAENLLTNLHTRIQRVKSLITQDTYRPGVFFQIGISPIVSVGTDTFLHELIVLAGGKNLADGKTPYPRFSREQVLALTPEIFIYGECHCQLLRPDRVRRTGHAPSVKTHLWTGSPDSRSGMYPGRISAGHAGAG